MIKNVGETVYKYTLKNGKFFVHEGIIVKGRIRDFAEFKDIDRSARLPEEDGFGVVCNGSTLWLAERDDELAKRIFTEWLENGIVELQEAISKKLNLIDLLKETEL